ncbi:hypothetical protein ACFVFS_06530 [Kitasatospora sp. NPDC057692]|uniref:hypothetical protein n=1 Tax=Kitasatospora sp. NPDC057692 TaxID=3346215 RepID=UPI003693AEB1
MSAHDHVPPVVDPGPAADPGPAPGRRLPRAAAVALATTGLLAVTAVSATVTVAVGKPGNRPAVTAAAVAPTSASPTASPSASPTASPSAAASASVAPPAPAPVPTSTVTGTVKDGRHDGDLRYFLLPIPQGGESYGPADGIPLSDQELIEEAGDGADIMRTLRSLGYKDAVTRTYRTADGKAEVTVTLLRFASASQAEFFAKYDTRDLPTIEVTGDSAARGYISKPKQAAYTGSMSGISSQGDVEYTIDVEVKGDPDKALLSDLMKRQRDWLTSGR